MRGAPRYSCSPRASAKTTTNFHFLFFCFGPATAHQRRLLALQLAALLLCSGSDGHEAPVGCATHSRFPLHPPPPPTRCVDSHVHPPNCFQTAAPNIGRGMRRGRGWGYRNILLLRRADGHTTHNTHTRTYMQAHKHTVCVPSLLRQ